MVSFEARSISALASNLANGLQTLRGLFHFYIDVDTTTFTHMAHALIIDLKLDSSPDQNHISRQSLLGAAWTHLNQTHLFRRKTTHSAADRRAIMGFYHISSA